MRINTNVAALNAYNNLSATNNTLSRSMEKLSSGFRINRAADDAAGLGIANRLRADTRAMTQASKNAEQANSVLQIAEGATSSIQKMLERMKELATQAGSDSVDTAGRERIQEEFSQLQEEITRTVDTTKFQGGFLLKTVAGSPATTGSAASTHANQNFTVASGTANDASVAGNGTYTGAADGTITIRKSATGWESSTNGTDFTTLTGTSVTIDGIDITITPGTTGAATGTTFTLAVTAAVPASPATEASGGARSFLVGSSEAYTTDDLLTIDAIDLTLDAGLGLDAATLATAGDARNALSTIDSAMATVATVLGDIGATQNRLEFAQSNLKTSIQNFSAAESVIRDLDMAEEMTKFSKNNILAQAGTAMLAQANQSAQGILQLLRG